MMDHVILFPNVNKWVRFDLSFSSDEINMNLSRAVKYHRNNERKRIQRANESTEESFGRRSGRIRNSLFQGAAIYVNDQISNVEENSLLY
ncbi:hypothetical protein AVEN_72982-1 [Araneus ventricosus]|uniref:Uncharacterized protein n=1 Tax=Araneus ventricosus TaxID=182803 RepID=A0A4Y2SS87_ARAVE|nr:hypothetical protein AVEN_72982-1 [Araneus ventricosus]